MSPVIIQMIFLQVKNSVGLGVNGDKTDILENTLKGWFEVVAAVLFLGAALYGINPGLIIVTAIVSGVVYTGICGKRVKKAEGKEK